MKLVKFLQKLNREQVTIELKNGTVISGTVVGVDATMNAHLKKAKLTARGKNPVSYATLSVRGSTVRAWLLPDGLNLDALLVEETKKVRCFVVDVIYIYVYIFFLKKDEMINCIVYIPHKKCFVLQLLFLWFWGNNGFLIF
jgi:small nuclear ribonucleoprotein D1